MTRQEEIQKLIDEETGIDNYGSLDYQIGVCDGVRLADKTMIEKACEWLDQNVVKYESGTKMGYIPFSLIEDMINDFRKAMEE